MVGLRYGDGKLYTRNAGDRRVFWEGPSVGFDAGGEGAFAGEFEPGLAVGTGQPQHAVARHDVNVFPIFYDRAVHVRRVFSHRLNRVEIIGIQLS